MVIELTVFDLATAHCAACRIAGIGETPQAQRAVEQSGGEDRVADGGAVLPADALNRIQRHLHRLVTVGGVRLWLRVELVPISLVPGGALPSESAGRYAAEGDIGAFSGLAGCVQPGLLIDTV